MMQPIVIENFLTDIEQEILLDASRNCLKAFEYASESIKIDRWKNRSAHVSHIEPFDPEAAQIMLEVGYRIQSTLRQIENNSSIYVEIPQFSRWFPGDDLDPPHADNCEQDGTPNYCPQRSHGLVVYLNDDFDGGELYYSNFDLQIKPKPKMLAMHEADLKFTHGVRKVLNKYRYTVITFAVTDHNFYVNNRASFLDDR